MNSGSEFPASEESRCCKCISSQPGHDIPFHVGIVYSKQTAFLRLEQGRRKNYKKGGNHASIPKQRFPLSLEPSPYFRTLLSCLGKALAIEMREHTLLSAANLFVVYFARTRTFFDHGICDLKISIADRTDMCAECPLVATSGLKRHLGLTSA